MAAKLKEHGFRRIRPLAGGFQAWVSAGFDVLEPGLLPGEGEERAAAGAETV